MSKLKQILTKISFALILCIMFSSIGIYTSAFSGLLDSYSGSCGLGGIDAVDTFYNDDGTFYAKHTINSTNYATSASMTILARESTWLGYSTRDTAYRSDIGTITITFYAPAGKYKLRFYANDTREYIRFYFDGEVYDTN